MGKAPLPHNKRNCYPPHLDHYLIISSIWLPQSRLLSIVTPRDLAVATWVTRKSLIAGDGETVTVLSLCQDPINMNSVSMNSQGALDKTKLAQNTF